MRKLITAICLSLAGVLGVVWLTTGGVVPSLAEAPPAPPEAPAHDAPLLGDVPAASTAEASPEQTPVQAARLLPPDQGAYFGAYAPEILQEGGIDDWEDRTGAELTIVHWYQGWGGDHPELNPEWLGWVAAHGAVPMVSWEPWRKPPGAFTDPDQPEFRLEVIADGRYDEYVRRWAESAAEFGHPMLVRPMHEMNGFWYPWSVLENDNTPADFVAAWRHIHDIFDEVGADNVSWVWAVNTVAGLPPENRDLDLASFYPGDDYVDWVSVIGFNYGAAQTWSSWQDVHYIFGETYDALLPFGKPIMISEVGTVQEGGDAAEWTAQTIEALQEDYEHVQAVVWFADERGDIDFRLDPAQRDVMRSAFRDDHWRPEVRTEPVPSS